MKKKRFSTIEMIAQTAILVIGFTLIIFVINDESNKAYSEIIIESRIEQAHYDMIFSTQHVEDATQEYLELALTHKENMTSNFYIGLCREQSTWIAAYALLKGHNVSWVQGTGINGEDIENHAWLLIDGVEVDPSCPTCERTPELIFNCELFREEFEDNTNHITVECELL